MLCDFGDFNDGVDHVMKIAKPTAESNPDVGLLTQQTVCVSPGVLARSLDWTELSWTEQAWRSYQAETQLI